MAQLNTRRIVRQCFVPGCGNTDSYMVYRGIEPWAKVVICKKCADELNAILNPFVPQTEDYDHIERILDKFLSLPAEKKEIVLKEADKILKAETVAEKEGKNEEITEEKPATAPKTTRKKAEAK